MVWQGIKKHDKSRNVRQHTCTVKGWTISWNSFAAGTVVITKAISSSSNFSWFSRSSQISTASLQDSWIRRIWWGGRRVERWCCLEVLVMFISGRGGDGEGGAVRVGDRRNVQLVRWRKEERHEEGKEGGKGRGMKWGRKEAWRRQPARQPGRQPDRSTNRFTVSVFRLHRVLSFPPSDA